MSAGDSLSRRDDELGRLIEEHIERIRRGESIEPEDILLAHPEHGAEILAALRGWLDLDVVLEDGPAYGEPVARRFGDYRLRREVGRGGMGVVYDAWQDSLDRRVALKMLPAGLAADDRASARFLREAQIAARLRHPNVVSVHGVGVEGHTPYYAMKCGCQP